MFAMRVTEVSDDGYGNAIVVGRSQGQTIGVIEPGQAVQWRRPDEQIGEGQIIYAMGGHLIVKGASSHEFAVGNIVWDR